MSVTTVLSVTVLALSRYGKYRRCCDDDNPGVPSQVEGSGLKNNHNNNNKQICIAPQGRNFRGAEKYNDAHERQMSPASEHSIGAARSSYKCRGFRRGAQLRVSWSSGRDCLSVHRVVGVSSARCRRMNVDDACCFELCTSPSSSSSSPPISPSPTVRRIHRATGT